jgi:predicted esterase
MAIQDWEKIIIPEPNEENIFDNYIGQMALPDRLSRRTGTLLEGMSHTWYEYVPSWYDGEKALPLVVSLHGARGTGHHQARSTGWHLVAERDGLMVIYPNSSTNIDTARDLENRWDNQWDGTDMHYLKALIDYAVSEYNIDASRIYMHGISNGDMMSLQFSLKHGEMLAGLASGIGPTPWRHFEKGDIFKPEKPLPVYQWRGEQDLIVPGIQREEGGDPSIRDDLNEFNKQLWIEIGGHEPIPQIRIRGKDNLEIYRGGSVPFLYNEVKDAPHQTDVYAADVMWREMLSGCRRGSDGEIFSNKPLDPPEGDKNAVAIALGENKAFIDNHVLVLQQSGPVMIGSSMYVPVQFLGQAFGAEVELVGEGKQAVVRKADGTTIGFSHGNSAVTVNNRITLLDQKTEFRDGMLMIPVQSVCEKLFHKNVSCYSFVAYISDHHAELTRGIARTLQRILKS